jgi:hypothetical protein
LSQDYYRDRFVFIVSVIVIAIIAMAALGRYIVLAKDTEILRFKVISYHFMTAAANARVEYLLTKIQDSSVEEKKKITLAGTEIYMSNQGWPAAIKDPVANPDYPSDEDCYALWILLLQNPAAIAKQNQLDSKAHYLVSAMRDRCRYQMASKDAFFDYFPQEGRVIFSEKDVIFLTKN